MRCREIFERSKISNFGYSRSCLLFHSFNEIFPSTNMIMPLWNTLLTLLEFPVYANSGSELYPTTDYCFFCSWQIIGLIPYVSIFIASPKLAGFFCWLLSLFCNNTLNTRQKNSLKRKNLTCPYGVWSHKNIAIIQTVTYETNAHQKTLLLCRDMHCKKKLWTKQEFSFPILKKLLIVSYHQCKSFSRR